MADVGAGRGGKFIVITVDGGLEELLREGDGGRDERANEGGKRG